MRAIIEYDSKSSPPKMRMFLHGAPHRRMHKAVLQKYRKDLWREAKKIDIPMPIQDYTELKVTFIDPCSCDLGNLYLALEQALDGKCGKGPTIFTDDRLICRLEASILWS